MESFTKYALYYAHKGLQVFPLKPGGKEPLGQLVPHGLLEATDDEQTIRQWWSSWPDANIGVRTGQESNIVVFDVDAGRGGEAAFSALMGRHELPATWIAETGGGGFHIWFLHPGGPVASTKDVVCQGVEIKGEGRYVVVPPSIHPNGTPYRWGKETKPSAVSLSSIPAWLVERMAPITSTKRFQRAAPVVGPIIEGSRNETLTSIAGTLRERGFELKELIVSLYAFNLERCQPPIPNKEVESIARSITRYPPGVPLPVRLSIGGR